ncbi:hypothetical protein GCM10010320_76080 [Streptomyces caelestis]|uniref:Uncharacterized protein n=1 Tax=Streptomyces caelestis TaxID=36816 RepID=A0A7W9GY93_9ACTN|nr:hypothetical protein [Streptomyces caelestis]GGW82937.1 hypothetical protein GCM10010320_76080 [Streptomyces caelestis]
MNGGPRFEEIGRQPTPMGEISLRRRRHPVSDNEVYEVKLGDEFWTSPSTDSGWATPPRQSWTAPGCAR